MADPSPAVPEDVLNDNQEVAQPPDAQEVAPVPPEDAAAHPDPSADLEAARATIEMLRTKVVEVSAARDSLIESLGSVQTTMAALQARVTDLEDETAELKQYKLQAADKLVAADAAEATISNLRSSLEDARRTLMRLQSGAGGEAARVPSGSSLLTPAAASESPTKRDKRMSLGVASRMDKAHRRVSSISDSVDVLPPPNVTKGGLRELRLSQAPPPPPPVAAGITSLFSGWGTGTSAAATAEVKEAANRASLTAGDQPQVDLSQTSDDDGVSPVEARRQAMARLQGGRPPTPPMPVEKAASTVNPDEFAELQSEVQALRRELVGARQAREASETACRALREFIAVPVAERERELEGMRLPPLPSDMADEPAAYDDHPQEKASVLSSWFKRKASSPSSAVAPGAVVDDSNASVAGSISTSAVDGTASTTAAASPPPLPHSTSFIASWTSSVSHSDLASPSQPPPVPSRTQSSLGSTSETPPPPPPPKPSRFNFFSLAKSGPSPSTPPAVSPGQEERSAASSPAPTLRDNDEAESQEQPSSPERPRDRSPSPVLASGDLEEDLSADGSPLMSPSDVPAGAQTHEPAKDDFDPDAVDDAEGQDAVVGPDVDDAGQQTSRLA